MKVTHLRKNHLNEAVVLDLPPLIIPLKKIRQCRDQTQVLDLWAVKKVAVMLIALHLKIIICNCFSLLLLVCYKIRRNLRAKRVRRIRRARANPRKSLKLLNYLLRWPRKTKRRKRSINLQALQRSIRLSIPLIKARKRKIGRLLNQQLPLL